MSDDLGTVWADRSDRERLVITGRDRAKFLHNLCTNDVKKLVAGRGCEAFVTSPQGKTLAWIAIHERGDDLLVRADPGGLALATPHFAKYSVFDEVEFRDASGDTFEIHLVGATASGLLPEGFPSEFRLDQELSVVAHRCPIGEVTLIRESPLGPEGITVIGPRSWRDSFVRGFERKPLERLRRLTAEDIEGARIEAGTPSFGADITADNLPQEIGRDSRTISFTKGCYLGQETVARLDALGHVNKLLRRLDVQNGSPPAPGTPIQVDGQPAGIVTSSGRSPRDRRGVALAMVRVKVGTVGAIAAWEDGYGIVIDRTAR
jgi:tRNA-modifying protein YgfZ